MLEVNSKELQNLGFDEVMDDEKLLEKLRPEIISECKNNIWYFVRRIAGIPTTYGNTFNQFELTPLGLELIWLFDKGFSVIVETESGYGCTTILATIASYAYLLEKGIIINMSIRDSQMVLTTGKITPSNESRNLKLNLMKDINTYSNLISGNLGYIFPNVARTIIPTISIKNHETTNKNADEFNYYLLSTMNGLRKYGREQQIIRIPANKEYSQLEHQIKDFGMIPFDMSFFDMNEYQIEELKRQKKFIYVNTETDRLASCNTFISQVRK